MGGAAASSLVGKDDAKVLDRLCHPPVRIRVQGTRLCSSRAALEINDERQVLRALLGASDDAVEERDGFPCKGRIWALVGALARQEGHIVHAHARQLSRRGSAPVKRHWNRVVLHKKPWQAVLAKLAHLAVPSLAHRASSCFCLPIISRTGREKAPQMQEHLRGPAESGENLCLCLYGIPLTRGQEPGRGRR